VRHKPVSIPTAAARVRARRMSRAAAWIAARAKRVLGFADSSRTFGFPVGALAFGTTTRLT